MLSRVLISSSIRARPDVEARKHPLVKSLAQEYVSRFALWSALAQQHHLLQCIGPVHGTQL
jgi:hypothetical protein